MKKIFLAALLSVASSASAQSTDAGGIPEGTRVKIRTATVHAAVGSVASSTADSVVLADDKGARLGVARSAVTQLYVSNGRTAVQGAEKGAAWGAGIGVIGAAMIIPDPCGNAPDKLRCKAAHEGESRGAIAAAFFGTSTLTGAIIGALVKAEEWKEVSSQTRFAIKPSGLGVVLAVNFR